MKSYKGKHPTWGRLTLVNWDEGHNCSIAHKIDTALPLWGSITWLICFMLGLSVVKKIIVKRYLEQGKCFKQRHNERSKENLRWRKKHFKGFIKEDDQVKGMGGNKTARSCISREKRKLKTFKSNHFHQPAMLITELYSLVHLCSIDFTTIKWRADTRNTLDRSHYKSPCLYLRTFLSCIYKQPGKRW